MIKLLGLDPEDYKEKTVQEITQDFQDAVYYYEQELRETDSKEILIDFMKVLSSILNALSIKRSVTFSLQTSRVFNFRDPGITGGFALDDMYKIK
jgi:hypothetical protein